MHSCSRLHAQPPLNPPPLHTQGTTTKLPVVGQPVQGFSGIRTLRSPNGKPNGQFVTLTDNGGCAKGAGGRRGGRGGGGEGQLAAPARGARYSARLLPTRPLAHPLTTHPPTPCTHPPGLGSKFNSYDSILMFHYVLPDFKAHTVRMLRCVGRACALQRAPHAPPAAHAAVPLHTPPPAPPLPGRCC